MLTFETTTRKEKEIGLFITAGTGHKGSVSPTSIAVHEFTGSAKDTSKGYESSTVVASTKEPVFRFSLVSSYVSSPEFPQPSSHSRRREGSVGESCPSGAAVCQQGYQLRILNVYFGLRYASLC